MGTRAGFTFALSSARWIFFPHLPTFGLLKHGGSFGGAQGAQRDEAAEAVGAGSWQKPGVRIRGQSSAAGLVWTGGKQTGFLLSFGSVQRQS